MSEKLFKKLSLTCKNLIIQRLLGLTLTILLLTLATMSASHFYYIKTKCITTKHKLYYNEKTQCYHHDWNVKFELPYGTIPENREWKTSLISMEKCPSLSKLRQSNNKSVDYNNRYPTSKEEYVCYYDFIRNKVNWTQITNNEIAIHVFYLLLFVSVSGYLIISICTKYHRTD